MFTNRSIRSMSRRDLLGWGGSCLLAPHAAWGKSAPSRPVVLTIDAVAKGTSFHFDMAALQRLPQVTFTTRTPWYEKPMQFSGPLLRDVLAAAGVQGTQLEAVALNDYKVPMPLEDTVRRGAIVALRLNGQPMAVRDKGPLFVVFPFDSSADLHTEKYYNRAVWQLRWLRVE